MNEHKRVKQAVFGMSGPLIIVGGVLVTIILGIIHPFLGLMGFSFGVMSFINSLDKPDRDAEGNEIKRKWYSMNSRVRNLIIGFLIFIGLILLAGS